MFYAGRCAKSCALPAHRHFDRAPRSGRLDLKSSHTIKEHMPVLVVCKAIVTRLSQRGKLDFKSALDRLAMCEPPQEGVMNRSVHLCPTQNARLGSLTVIFRGAFRGDQYSSRVFGSDRSCPLRSTHRLRWLQILFHWRRVWCAYKFACGRAHFLFYSYACVCAQTQVSVSVAEDVCLCVHVSVTAVVCICICKFDFRLLEKSYRTFARSERARSSSDATLRQLNGAITPVDSFIGSAS